MKKLKKLELKITLEFNETELKLIQDAVHGQEIFEYRDPEYPTLSGFLKSHRGFKGDDYYLRRNNGGTLKDMEALVEKGIFTTHLYSHHCSYELSDYGKALIAENPQLLTTIK